MSFIGIPQREVGLFQNFTIDIQIGWGTRAATSNETEYFKQYIYTKCYELTTRQNKVYTMDTIEDVEYEILN